MQDHTATIARNETAPVLKGAATLSDETAASDLAARVAASLKASGYAALQEVATQRHEDIVFLRGRVPSFDMKQIAHAVAGRVHGVGLLVNLISVDSAFGES